LLFIIKGTFLFVQNGVYTLLQVEQDADIAGSSGTSCQTGSSPAIFCASIESGVVLNIILIQVLSGIFFEYLGFFFNSEQ